MELELEPAAPIETTAVGHRILGAAARLFFEEGIAATGVDRIVEEAGTTKRTLYQRFGSKEALVAAYLQDRARRWQSDLLAAVAEAEPEAVLDIVYDQAEAWARAGRRGCAFASAWSEIGAGQHLAREVIRSEKAWMLALLTRLADGDAARGATLRLLYEGAQIAAAIDGDAAAFATAREASRALLS